MENEGNSLLKYINNLIFFEKFIFLNLKKTKIYLFKNLPPIPHE